MNILKIETKRAVEHSPFLKKIAIYQSVYEKAKLIRGDPPKIAFKRRGSPLKTSQIFTAFIT
jgi:hypothetical protein